MEICSDDPAHNASKIVSCKTDCIQQQHTRWSCKYNRCLPSPGTILVENWMDHGWWTLPLSSWFLYKREAPFQNIGTEMYRCMRRRRKLKHFAAADCSYFLLRRPFGSSQLAFTRTSPILRKEIKTINRKSHSQKWRNFSLSTSSVNKAEKASGVDNNLMSRAASFYDSLQFNVARRIPSRHTIDDVHVHYIKALFVLIWWREVFKDCSEYSHCDIKWKRLTRLETKLSINSSVKVSSFEIVCQLGDNFFEAVD